MKTPPKDGTMILAQFKGYPAPLAAMWNGTNKEWVVAVPEVGAYNGVWEDTFFETEGYPDEEMEAWTLIVTAGQPCPYFEPEYFCKLEALLNTATKTGQAVTGGSLDNSGEIK